MQKIFIAYWEEKALEASTKKPLQYFRYLDDIWGIRQYQLEDFYTFLDIVS